VLSWALRPPNRRLWRLTPTAQLVTKADGLILRAHADGGQTRS
jgi:hypothetical protein